MNIIVQEDPTGCGIACAAMIAGKSYHAVKRQAKQLGIVSDDRNLYSDTCHLRTLLGSYNITIGKNVPFKNWQEMPPVAILAVKQRKRDIGSTWHWVVYRRTDSGPVVLDPQKDLRSNVRTDFNRLRPEWYIKVNK